MDPEQKISTFSSLGEELERGLMEEMAPSPIIAEPPSPSESEETEEQGMTQRNTIAATAEEAVETSSETTPILKRQQMRESIAFLCGGTRKSKAKEPQVYRTEPHKLRGWPAQLIVYYRTVGWQNGHDEEKILYATSLLRDNRVTWITGYAEEPSTPTWDNRVGFKGELQRQFGVIKAKEEARITRKNMKQGK